MKTIFRVMRLGIAAAAVAWLAPDSARAQADDFDWIAAGGGDWDHGPNWRGGAAPTGNARPIFYLDETYTVTFNNDVTTRLHQFLNGTNVTFDLNGYTLTSPTSAYNTPSFQGGASLAVITGTWNAAHTFILDGGSTLTAGAGATVNYSLSSTTGDGRLRIGNESAGILDVIDGGTFTATHTAGYFAMAMYNDSEGTVNVRGDGSTLTQSGVNFFMAGGFGGGDAYMNITESGHVRLTGETGGFFVGYGIVHTSTFGSEGKGTVLVSGRAEGAAAPSRLVIDDKFRHTYVGYFAGSEGTITVAEGGLVSLLGETILGFQGAQGDYGAARGTIVVRDGDSLFHARRSLGVGGQATGVEWVGTPGGIGRLDVRDGGTLQVGTATDHGRLYVFDGSRVEVASGRVEARSLMLANGSELAVAIGAHDPAEAMISISGEVRLYGNTLEVDVDEGTFVFGYGDVYRVIEFGTLNADFNRFDGYGDGDVLMAQAGNPTEYQFQLNYGTLAGHEDFVTLMAIPEPGTLWLLAAGGLLVALRRRRCGIRLIQKEIR